MLGHSIHKEQGTLSISSLTPSFLNSIVVLRCRIISLVRNRPVRTVVSVRTEGVGTTVGRRTPDIQARLRKERQDSKMGSCTLRVTILFLSHSGECPCTCGPTIPSGLRILHPRSDVPPSSFLSGTSGPVDILPLRTESLPTYHVPLLLPLQETTCETLIYISRGEKSPRVEIGVPVLCWDW